VLSGGGAGGLIAGICAAQPSWVPERVLITGGREVGGLASFAEALAHGFHLLGVPAEVIPPSRIWSRWRELRSARVLKILSTSAIFASPFSRSAPAVSHGFPTAGVIGWKKFLGHLAADGLASGSSPFVTVSEYSAVHLRSIFGLRVDAVVPNSLRRVFLEAPEPAAAEPRRLLTFAGRLHRSKHLRRLLPVVCEVLEEHPELEVCVIGEGPERPVLEALAAGHSRVAFTGTLSALALRDRLRRTRVFFSGCPTEALGIAYLEALSQGCNVVMPACGGGLEIAPHLIGSQIQLMPLTFEPAAVAGALRRALAVPGTPLDVEPWSPRSIAAAWLRVASRFGAESPELAARPADREIAEG
jgi:glycosyltransferase involved in cell wall biosynthesis